MVFLNANSLGKKVERFYFKIWERDCVRGGGGGGCEDPSVRIKIKILLKLMQSVTTVDLYLQSLMLGVSR